MIGIDPEKLGLKCPRCGGTNTYENTKDFGRVVMTGTYCSDCGSTFWDGNESPYSIYIKRIKVIDNT